MSILKASSSQSSEQECKKIQITAVISGSSLLVCLLEALLQHLKTAKGKELERCGTFAPNSIGFPVIGEKVVRV